MTAIRERQRAQFIYTKGKNITKPFYIQKAWHFAKSKTIFVTFLYTKSKTLYITRFFMKIWSCPLYTKIMTLCVRWRFRIQKVGHFEKSKLIWVTFYIQKWGQFASHNVSLNFWNWLRGEDCFCCKKMHFVLPFYTQKKMHYALHFYI